MDDWSETKRGKPALGMLKLVPKQLEIFNGKREVKLSPLAVPKVPMLKGREHAEKSDEMGKSGSVELFRRVYHS